MRIKVTDETNHGATPLQVRRVPHKQGGQSTSAPILQSASFHGLSKVIHTETYRLALTSQHQCAFIFRVILQFVRLTEVVQEDGHGVSALSASIQLDMTPDAVLSASIHE